MVTPFAQRPAYFPCVSLSENPFVEAQPVVGADLCLVVWHEFEYANK